MSTELTQLCESIVRNAMPATASGQTCFVPRYQLDALAKLLATPTPPAAEVWQPIETAPKERAPMIVVRGVLESGYVTDPWCVWWQDGCWQRWPHKEQPTHWLPLPPLHHLTQGAAR